MILQALKEYYDRKLDLPRLGWFDGYIDFAIVINMDGSFAGLQPCFDMKGNKRERFSCRLPYVGKQARKHTMKGDDANLLWDNATFVLGLGKNGVKKLDSFISAIREKLAGIDDPAVDAVIIFLEGGRNDRKLFGPVLNDSKHAELINKGGVSMTFRMNNDDAPFVFDRPLIKNRISEGLSESKLTGACLVTGAIGVPIEENHLVIKNLYGAKKDPNVVSFNAAAYRSYGKTRGDNAPVSSTVAFAYTTALNHLTNSNNNKLQLGDATVVFWSERETQRSKEVEEFFGSVMKDDPDQMVTAVEAMFKSVKTGAFVEDDLTIKFFVLGMTPFRPRIAIRFWIVDTIKEMSDKICSHFHDIEIVQPQEP
ncbi:MAG: type I-C CRISPR-associated protein Cas8c/Csd1, partial [Kiritimatiellales bacterium]|nr:type I-C CRISPR-associated protein Cas8c/Csd1 [Kiritimatiellales bacterium]